MSRVAVIIVTFNSARFLPALCISLKSMQHPDGGVQFIFVDNASDDHSPELALEAMPDAIVVREKENKGFSAGVNAGIRHPLAQSAEFIALLNPDTVVDVRWLIELVNAMDGHPQAASAQSLLLYMQDQEIVNSNGNEIHFLGFGYSRNNGVNKFQLLAPSFQLHSITYASGAAALYRRRALEEIGLFEEDLFMYHDDLDVGWKFLLKGYQNIFIPTSIVYHHYEFSRSIKKYYWMERNRLLLLLTHYKAGTFLMVLPALIVLEAGLTLFALYRGFFSARLRAYLWIISHLQLVVQKHKIAQNLRKVTDKTILQSFTGAISDQEIHNPLVEYVMNPVFSAYLFLLKRLIWW
ncbi:MAG: glycosyltransferase family 2 protein [Patescibacteria group bacterium]